MRLLVLLFSIVTTIGCSGGANSPRANVIASPVNTVKPGPLPVAGYEIVNKFPHDPRAFTQGLVFHNGFLYESTGSEGRSSLRKVELATGKVVKKFDLSRDVFAEGMTILNGKIYQISWQNGLAWEYDLEDFKLLREMSYTGEGWGLTTDGTNLIMSEGRHLLKIIDPQTFKSIRIVPVLQDNGKPLYLLNELEWVKGEVWANLWHSEETETGTTQGRLPNIGRPNTIARIDPASGRLLGWIDLAGISPDDQNDTNKHENTLNGIAYDAESDRIFVTGKQWKNLYEIKLRPKQSQ